MIPAALDYWRLTDDWRVASVLESQVKGIRARVRGGRPLYDGEPVKEEPAECGFCGRLLPCADHADLEKVANGDLV